MTFKSYFVTQFQLLFSNDSIHWSYEEEPIGRQKTYKCVQCEVQHLDGNEIVMYNLLKPIVTRFIRIKIITSRSGPCMRMELIGCRGDKKSKSTDLSIFWELNFVLNRFLFPYVNCNNSWCDIITKLSILLRSIQVMFLENKTF